MKKLKLQMEALAMASSLQLKGEQSNDRPQIKPVVIFENK